jgi:phospholipase/carboxylesterase
MEQQLAPVASWLDALPFDPARIVLGGWSQGAGVAYALGLSAGRPRPAGLLALGGIWLPKEVDLDLRGPLPAIAIAHGTLDDAVDVQFARQARDCLESAGATVFYLETAVGHEIDQATIPDLRGFLAALPLTEGGARTDVRPPGK